MLRTSLLAFTLALALFHFCPMTSGVIFNIQLYPDLSENNTRCQTDYPSLLCDPDSVFGVEDRKKLEALLQDFERDTAINGKVVDASDKCKNKGIRLAMALFQNEILAPQNLYPKQSTAQYLNNKWALDKECMKQVVIVYNANKRTIIAAGGDAAPIYSADFAHIFLREKALLDNGSTLQAFENILRNLKTVAIVRENSFRQVTATHSHGPYMIAAAKGPSFNPYDYAVVGAISLVVGALLLAITLWTYHQCTKSQRKSFNTVGQHVAFSNNCNTGGGQLPTIDVLHTSNNSSSVIHTATISQRNAPLPPSQFGSPAQPISHH